MSFLHPNSALMLCREFREYSALVTRVPQIARVRRGRFLLASTTVSGYPTVVSQHLPRPGIGGGGMGGAGGCGGVDCTVLSFLGSYCCLLLVFCFCSSCCLLLVFCFCSSCCLLLHFCLCSSCFGLVVLLISIGISFTCGV